jgi:hypothetical protein
MVPPLLRPSQFNDFVFGPFDEERAMEMARHYHEGMEPKVSRYLSIFRVQSTHILLPMLPRASSVVPGCLCRRVVHEHVGA